MKSFTIPDRFPGAPPISTWLTSPSHHLTRLCAPRRENPIFGLLVRRWRRHMHRVPDHILWGSVALALLSAALVPTRFFSFFIWHAVLFGHVLWPAVIFPFTLRQSGSIGDELLVVPLHPGRYVQAVRSLFGMAMLYAAIPYAAYWLALLALRPWLFPQIFAGWPIAVVMASAVLYFAALTALLWFTLWCAAAGGAWLALPAVAAPLAVFSYAWDYDRLMGLEPFPVTPGFWLAALSLFLFGHLITVAMARSRQNPFLPR